MRKREIANCSTRRLVRAKGLEPPRLAPPDPKSGVSTNSTTPAGAARPIGLGQLSASISHAVRLYTGQSEVMRTLV